MSKILSLFLTLSFVLFSTTSVMADGDTTSPTPSPMTKKVTKTVCTTSGAYGSTTECKDEVVEENITREFDVTEVDTGIAEIAIIASALFFGGLGLFFVAQNQLK